MTRARSVPCPLFAALHRPNPVPARTHGWKQDGLRIAVAELCRANAATNVALRGPCGLSAQQVGEVTVILHRAGCDLAFDRQGRLVLRYGLSGATSLMRRDCEVAMHAPFRQPMADRGCVSSARV